MAPTTSTPTKRHWGWGLALSILGLIALGLGIGDFFVGKSGPGVVVVALGLALGGLGVWCFRTRFVPPPPPPPLGWKRPAAALLAGVLAGLAFPICFPVFSHHEQFASGYLEIFAWVGLIPLCWALDGATPRRGFGLTMLAGMAFFNFTFWWVNVAMTTFGGLPNVIAIPVLQGLVAWCAVQWGLAGWTAVLVRRQFGLPAWLALPITWCSAELLRNYFMSGYPWANLGYATTRDLPFAQVASLGGIYLIAFCVVLVNGALYEFLASRVRKDRPFPKRALATAVAIVVLGHGYGAMRLHRLEPELASARHTKVGLVQGNIDQKIKNRHESYYQFILQQYVPQTDLADDEGAEVIVWPEAAFPGYFDPAMVQTGKLKLPGFDRTEYRAPILLGVGMHEARTNRSTNSAFWVNRDLRVISQYDKHHLVPFGEYVLWDLDRYLPIGSLTNDVGLFEAGDVLPLWQLSTATGPLKVGMLICYDAIFPEITRNYAQRDTDLLVNITNDAWYGFSSAPYQFLRMVQMRAIESGRSVARAANTGVSGAFDPVGHLLGQTEIGLVNSSADEVDSALHVPATHLNVDIPILRLHTLYAVIGDVFAYACVLVTLLAMWRTFRQGRRAASSNAA